MQFVVRVYPNGPRWRVVVEGVTQFDVSAVGDVDPRTREVVLAHLKAFLPERALPVPDPAAARVAGVELDARIVEAGRAGLEGERNERGGGPVPGPPSGEGVGPRRRKRPT